MIEFLSDRAFDPMWRLLGGKNMNLLSSHGFRFVIQPNSAMQAHIDHYTLEMFKKKQVVGFQVPCCP